MMNKSFILFLIPFLVILLVWIIWEIRQTRIIIGKIEKEEEIMKQILEIQKEEVTKDDGA